MTTFKRVALFAALFAAQLALAAACHAHEILATADYPDGVQVVLTDVMDDDGICRAAVSVSPDKTEMVPGCWTMKGDKIVVDFLLGDDQDGAVWTEEYPLSDFRRPATATGKSV